MKISRILSIIFFGAALTSCNDWLDVEPSTELDRNQLFSTEDGFADGMSGIYIDMSSNALYGKTLSWYFTEIIGGTALVNSSGYNYSYSQFSFHPETTLGNYYSNHRAQTIDPVWRAQYNTIASINSMLGCIDDQKSVFEGHDYEVFKGEALGLRAFLHFDLLRLYSDAPSSENYSASKKYIPYVNELTSQVFPLLSVEDACKFMLKDLADAKELLKYDPMYLGETPTSFTASAVTGAASYRDMYNVKDWHNRRFHFNYYAVVATMARIYLWLGDKQNALACAKECIEAQDSRFFWVNNDLIANISKTGATVSRDRTFCTEHIFAMNVNDLMDRMDGIISSTASTYTTSSLTMGINFNYCFDDEATRNADPRYEYLKYVHTSTFYIPTKLWQDEDQSDNYSPWARNRIPLIRMSEMYYIAAECEPNLAQATEYLETVRRHRGLASYPVSAATAEDLQNEIEREYRKEFISEGQMFYYKKRLNQEITIKNASKETVVPTTLFCMPRPDDENTYGGRN